MQFDIVDSLKEEANVNGGVQLSAGGWSETFGLGYDLLPHPKTQPAPVQQDSVNKE